MNDLLDLTQLKKGNFKLTQIEFNIRPAIYEVVNVFKEQAKLRQNTLVVLFDENLPSILYSDYNRLQ